jgi:DNA-binding XRE family transcriptional regulator
MSPADIKTLRKRLNLSQAQFAQLFGVHSITIIRWENGDALPTDYQTALMDSFEKSAENREVRETIGKVLIGAGIVAALFLLLGAAIAKGAKK